jgi:hypothetical protein
MVLNTKEVRKKIILVTRKRSAAALTKTAAAAAAACMVFGEAESATPRHGMLRRRSHVIVL